MSSFCVEANLELTCPTTHTIAATFENSKIDKKTAEHLFFFYHGTSDHDLRDGLKISGYLTLNSKFPRTQTSRTSVQYSILCVNTIIFGFSKNKLHTRLCLYSLMQTNSMQRKHSTKFGRMCRVLLIGKPKVSLKKMLPRSKKHHRSVLEFFFKKETELFARCCSRKS